MIRINLLSPPRARTVRKQWDVRLEIICAFAVLLLTCAVCVYYADMLDNEIEEKHVEKQGKEKQLALLKEKVKQVQDFEQKKKLLEDKNRVIDELEKSRAGPVRVLDYVSQSLNPLNLWLTRLSMKGHEIELEGRALTNDDVVEFVNNLRQANYFGNIRLIESRSGAEAKINIYQFKLNLTLKA
jgi:type IV pilus assembly protein PilN